MDSNGLNFWMLSGAADWLPPGGSETLYFCPEKRRLRLRSRRHGPPPVEDFTQATALIETTPATHDTFGNYARWDAAASKILAGGVATGEVAIYTPPPGQKVTDLAMGYDGVLYLAVSGALVLVDRRNRWPDFTLTVPGFRFWRLAALPEGGVMALDRNTPQLGRVSGLPLQVEPVDAPGPGVLRSCQANGAPPKLAAQYALPATETWTGITAQPDGSIALLSWAKNDATNKSAFLRRFTEDGGLASPWTLTGTAFPYALASVGEGQFAVLATGLREALIFDVSGASSSLVPAGDAYILAGLNAGPFVHTLNPPVHYTFGADLLPLLPLSLNTLAAWGETAPFAARVIDSGSSQTMWHRLFLEAVLPPRCGVVVWLAASNEPADFSAETTQWHPHAFGDTSGLTLSSEVPRATWITTACEIPFAKPMLDEEPAVDARGLFMALVQRGGTAVRNLVGRYLAMRVRLLGDGRGTPEVAAARIYGSRFSYVDHYLPEIYREKAFGPDADAPGPSTRENFFERFVNIFEAQMTRIEDSIAASYLLTRPETTPASAIAWLGGWIGVDPTLYPPRQRRRLLLEAPELHRNRGTVAGIAQAIDIATAGLASKGAVIVVEGFRLRHTFATILGADLAITDDPLLPGFNGNSNSFVGDTLFLGDPRNPDFLAEFAGSVELPSEAAQVQAFLDSLASRMIVFVHNRLEAVDVNLVRRMVEAEKPAHIAARLVTATQPLLIGLASLLGVNTFLEPEPAANPVVAGQSRVGRYDIIQHAPSLDPRWENGGANV